MSPRAERPALNANGTVRPSERPSIASETVRELGLQLLLFPNVGDDWSSSPNVMTLFCNSRSSSWLKLMIADEPEDSRPCYDQYNTRSKFRLMSLPEGCSADGFLVAMKEVCIVMRTNI